MRATGWSPKSPAHRDRMRRAFTFICEHFGPGYLGRSVTSRQRGASPFALTINGATPVWLSWMQAINFDCDVFAATLGANVALCNFREPGEGSGGNWYCKPATPQEKTATKPSQTLKKQYLTLTATPVLVSTAGDLLVDWNMKAPSRRSPTEGRDYWYRSGGATQYLVPNANARLKPL